MGRDLDFVPVSRPNLQKIDWNRFLNSVKSGELSSTAEVVSEFESRIAEYVGRRFAIAVSSGTAALEISLKALGITFGDEVIVPSMSIISCSQSVTKLGARIRPVDSRIEDFNVDVNLIEKSIGEKTRAILGVHTYGIPANFKEIIRVASKYGLLVIEDAAEALGSSLEDRKCGSFGDVSILSFYPNKTITTGEGGMILTDDEFLAKKCRDLRNLCFSTSRRFMHEELGWNYRLSGIQATLGLLQCEEIDSIVNRKSEIGRLYDEVLPHSPDFRKPLKEFENRKNYYWVYPILLSEKWNLEKIMNNLRNLGIETRPSFYPAHLQPVYRDMFPKPLSLPIAERIASGVFYLPSGPGTTDEDILRSANSFLRVLDNV